MSCSLVVFEEQNHWWEWTWTWIQFVSCPSNIEWMMWISHWWEWPHMHSASEFLSIFQQIRISEPLTKMVECLSRMWVALQCFCRLELLTRMVEHVSSLWVTSHWLSRSELLMREHLTPIQKVSCSSVFEQICTTDKRLNTSSEWVGRVVLQCLCRSYG